MKVIAYDVGTTGLKTCLFEISREQSVRFVAGVVERYALNILCDGGAEQNPDEWWEAMCRSTRELLETTGVPKEEIGGVSFCSQMQTVVMTDEAGRALRPSMSCMDTRGAGIFARCMATGLKIEGLNLVKSLRFMKITGAISASCKDPAWSTCGCASTSRRSTQRPASGSTRRNTSPSARRVPCAPAGTSRA